jgi:hypothetical protein
VVTLSIYGSISIEPGVAAASQSAIEIHLYVFQNLADGSGRILRSRWSSRHIPPITSRFRFALIERVIPLTHPTLWGLFAMDEEKDPDEGKPWVDPNCHVCDERLVYFDRDTWVCPFCSIDDEDED